MDGMNIAEYQGNPNKGLKEGVVREDFSGEGYFPRLAAEKSSRKENSSLPLSALWPAWT